MNDPKSARDDAPPATERTPWAELAVVLLLALVVRTGAVAAQFSLLKQDPDGYRQLAITLRQTGVYGFGKAPTEESVQPTAYRPPLYPLVLALLVSDGALAPHAVAGLHAVLGAATVAMVFLLGKQAGLGHWSLLAAVVTICDPILLRQSALVMTETLAASLAATGLGVLAGFSRRPSAARAALAGAVLGLAVLCRPTFFFWLAPVAAAMFVFRRLSSRREYALVLVLAAAAALAPWTIRNYLHFGRPIFATTHGGYTLWLGNNDLYYDHLLKGRGVFDAERLLPRLEELRATGVEGEVAFDRLLNREARETIRRRPLAFLYASAVRVGHLWRLTPQQIREQESTLGTVARRAVGVWYAAVFVLALVGAASRGRRLAAAPWLWTILLCLAFTAVHAAYWTDMRMRAPLMPAVALFAAAGAAGIRRGGRSCGAGA